ncbi:hypothetical protein E2F50_00425 [Rhizobium deserti]|uniref:Uncharacterized protein n=1 Tax=Rhizobium deserti TaxID=2547961 RepID=A0A4V3APP6_9HYPH|nr:hypothetical protein [Rhizobium deserti]TDK38660.1 hypothetical protein E2F50_00425 [Rhizobium deserti]
MSEYRFSFPACLIVGKGHIDREDVILMRKYAFPDGIACPDDADALLALHRACQNPCAEWERYFVESLTSFVVHEISPKGAFNDAKADWLIDLLACDGVVPTPLELELLLHAMEVATDVPDRLSAFALDQIRYALLAADQCGYAESRPPADAVTLYDLAYVWRVLRRVVHHGQLVASPRETEVLVEINMLASPLHNHAGWNELMAQVATQTHPYDALASLRYSISDQARFCQEGRAA